VAGQGIDANAQNLGIEAGELLQFVVERRQLQGSGGCPVQGMESEDNVLAAPEGAEPYAMALFADDGGQFEIGSHFTG
jgi:hypothetical protein